MDRHGAPGLRDVRFHRTELRGASHWAELTVHRHPTTPIRRVLMIDDAELRRTHLEALQRVAPDFIPSLCRGDYRPFRKPEHMTMLLDSLRKAGLAS